MRTHLHAPTSRTILVTALVTLCAASSAATTPKPTPTASANTCIGDCNGDGVVAINELITAVNIDLGLAEVDACPALSCDGAVELASHPGIGCSIAAVNNLLNGCPRGSLTDLLVMTVRIERIPNQPQLGIVASVEYGEGAPLFYAAGCTAQCYPQFLRAIVFDVVGPSGPVIIDNCGAPTYCAEGFMSLAAHGHLNQVLSVTGTAFEKSCTYEPYGTCTATDLPPGHYTATARFNYATTPDFSAPEQGISQTVEFDWPPNG
jgi:hypothetical protein